MNMADTIAKRRKEKGLTQKQLADKLGVTDKAVSKWERGNGYPDITYLEPLAAALEVNVSDLLKGKAENPDQESDNDNDDTIIKNTLDYADSVYKTRSQNRPRILMFSLLALGLAGIITTSIVDFALNGRFTWSLLSVSAIIFSWLILVPLFLFKKRAIDIALLSTSIFVFLFLFIINCFTGGDWFAPIAVPVAIAGIVTLWLIRFVFATKLSVFNKLAASCLIGAPVNIAIPFILDRVLDDGGLNVWNLMSVAILLVLAMILYAMGSARKTDNGRYIFNQF